MSGECKEGFLLGQLSIATLIFVFIKFFIFGEAPSPPSARSRRYSSHISRRLGPKKSASALRPVPSLSSAQILSKTYYNVNAHQPESVDWFNVLFAQTIAQLRTDAQRDNAIITTLNEVLNGEKKPDFIGDIRVTEINLGDEFPIFSNCRIMPVVATDAGGRPSSSASTSQPFDPSTRLQARMDVDLADNITLGIETKLVLNYPKPLVAVMPVALAVSVVRFSGTLSISFIPSPANDAPESFDDRDSRRTKPKTSLPPSPTFLTFSFRPDYRLELSTRSLLGSRSRLQDVPKIAQLVEGRLHSWFDERCVEPKFQRVTLPSLWPRMKNAGTRDEEAAAAAFAASAAATAAGPAAAKGLAPFGAASERGLGVSGLLPSPSAPSTVPMASASPSAAPPRSPGSPQSPRPRRRFRASEIGASAGSSIEMPGLPGSLSP